MFIDEESTKLHLENNGKKVNDIDALHICLCGTPAIRQQCMTQVNAVEACIRTHMPTIRCQHQTHSSIHIIAALVQLSPQAIKRLYLAHCFSKRYEAHPK